LKTGKKRCGALEAIATGAFDRPVADERALFENTIATQSPHCAATAHERRANDGIKLMVHCPTAIGSKEKNFIQTTLSVRKVGSVGKMLSHHIVPAQGLAQAYLGRRRHAPTPRSRQAWKRQRAGNTFRRMNVNLAWLFRAAGTHCKKSLSAAASTCISCG